ncbi:hypothetical protein [Streptomyces sp. NPDC001591]|uniref:hypothetical protein n=1 Tax=Streptomyces sp. NPDC001591 TaxID=3364589 RepID=UPI00368A2E41
MLPATPSQLIASRYEQGPVTVTSNLPFEHGGETFATTTSRAGKDNSAPVSHSAHQQYSLCSEA